MTVLKVGPCVITQLKTVAKDGYDAAQIGPAGSSRLEGEQGDDGHFPKRMCRRYGRFAKSRWSRQLEGEDDQTAKAGDSMTVEIFYETKFVDVIGNSRAADLRRGSAAWVRRRTQVARTHVPGAGFDWRLVVSVARVSRVSVCRVTWARTR